MKKVPLNEKVVVITGASSGAGRATAIEFAKHGAKLILASRNEHILEEVVKECEELGSLAISVITDVSDPKDVIALADAANDFGNKIDVWVNNAGVLALGEFDRTPIETHDQVIQTNLMGYLHGAHAVLPYFKKQGYGTLINNISIGGYLPVPYGAGYSASKFGLRGFSEALKAELYKWPDIHICDTFSAFLDTPGIQHAANYTGKIVRPAPPVYDPQRHAQTIVSLTENPKPAVMVGSFATLLRLAHAVLPTTTLKIMSGVISSYFKIAESLPTTNGNLFNPVDYGTSIHGGWGIPGKPKAHRKYIAAGFLLAGLTAGMLLLKKGK
jgi:short-subunit dehydrogenase